METNKRSRHKTDLLRNTTRRKRDAQVVKLDWEIMQNDFYDRKFCCEKYEIERLGNKLISLIYIFFINHARDLHNSVAANLITFRK